MVRHRILISQMFQLLNDGTHEIVLVVQHQGAPRRLQEFDYLLKPLKKKIVHVAHVHKKNILTSNAVLVSGDEM
jgi:hypothetical protein